MFQLDNIKNKIIKQLIEIYSYTQEESEQIFTYCSEKKVIINEKEIYGVNYFDKTNQTEALNQN